MGSYRVDVSRWPIVIQATEGTLTDAEVDAFIEEATAAIKGRGRYVVIQDARKIGKVSGYLRSRSVAWQREHFDELKRDCLGTVHLFSSPLMRFISMTVLMMTRLPTAYTVAASMEEAIAWAEE